MEKTYKLFKKIGDTKGNFHAKMGTIKDKNSKGLTDAEEIKKRWLKYAEKLCQKFLMTWIITMPRARDPGV